LPPRSAVDHANDGDAAFASGIVRDTREAEPGSSDTRISRCSTSNDRFRRQTGRSDGLQMSARCVRECAACLHVIVRLVLSRIRAGVDFPQNPVAHNLLRVISDWETASLGSMKSNVNTKIYVLVTNV